MIKLQYFFYFASLLLATLIAFFGWNIGAEMMTAPDTFSNIVAPFILLLTFFIDYYLLKFSYKHFIKS